MDVLDSSRSSAEKTLSPCGSSPGASSASSSSKARQKLQTPTSTLTSVPKRPHRRVDSGEISDEIEDRKQHHHVLSFLFFFVFVSLFLMWSLDICCFSFMKGIAMGSRPLKLRNTPSTTAPPSPNRMEDNLDGMAAEAKNNVRDFFEQAGGFRCPQPERFTRDFIARHHTADDLWVVIDGNVLDVSLFIRQHPGGRVLLEGAGGQDMASAFARSHHPSSIALFVNFCIGRVADQ